MSKLLDGETPSSTSYKARLIASHIARHASTSVSKPLMVGLQGPQGCGKTTVCNALLEELRHTHSLRAAVLSLDDLYRTNAELKRLASRHPDVKLLHGRGQPGTHDIDLATSVLQQVSQINIPHQSVHLPIFDKSLCDGEGDRSADSVLVEGPLDVFILEGWSMGFQPLEADRLAAAYRTFASTSTTPTTRADQPAYFTEHSLASLITVNDHLSAFAAAVYPFFSVFVQIEPTTYQDVFNWRLEQEHAMKSANGGRGMTDEQVDAFVRRYMPGYELWKEGIWDESMPWHGRGLRLFYGSEREITNVERR